MRFPFSRFSVCLLAILALSLFLLAHAPAVAQDCAGGSCTLGTAAQPPAPLPLPWAVQRPRIDAIAHIESFQAYSQSSVATSTGPGYAIRPLRLVGLFPRISRAPRIAARRAGWRLATPSRHCR